MSAEFGCDRMRRYRHDLKPHSPAAIPLAFLSRTGQTNVSASPGTRHVDGKSSMIALPSSPILHSYLKRNPRRLAQRDRFPRPYRTDPDSVVPWSSESPQSLTEASQCADDFTRDRTLWMPRDTTKHALPGSQCRFTPLRVACLGTWRITQKCTQSCTQLQGRRNLTF
jgi:hypothetical protein